MVAIFKLVTWREINLVRSLCFPSGHRRGKRSPVMIDVPNMLVVGATNITRQKTEISNWGKVTTTLFVFHHILVFLQKSVHVFAEGANIMGLCNSLKESNEQLLLWCGLNDRSHI